MMKEEMQTEKDAPRGGQRHSNRNRIEDCGRCLLVDVSEEAKKFGIQYATAISQGVAKRFHDSTSRFSQWSRKVRDVLEALAGTVRHGKNGWEIPLCICPTDHRNMGELEWFWATCSDSHEGTPRVVIVQQLRIDEEA